MKQFPPIDLFSFLFGFVLAVLIIVAVLQIGKLRSKLKVVSQKQVERQKLSKRNAFERDLRIYLLRKYQRQHLASGLFSLNDIYVELKLQSTIKITNPEQSYEDEPTIFKHHMQFNDFPELISGKPVPLISLSEALSGGKNIAIMNEIGSGKTTLLAHFASEILEKKCLISDFNQSLPIFVHINELDYVNTNAPGLIAEISKALCYQNPRIEFGSTNEILVDYLSNNSLILIIDGMDELRPEQFQQAVKLINSVNVLYPQLRLIVGIGPSYSSNLYKAGFSFLTIQAPGRDFQNALVKRWCKQFEVSDRDTNLRNDPSETLLTSLWTQQETSNLLPYDLTLEIWNYLSPASTDFSDNNTIGMMERLLQGQISVHTIENIAETIEKNDYRGIQSTQITRLLKEDQTRLESKNQSTLPGTSHTISTSSSISNTSSSTSEIGLMDLTERNLFVSNKAGMVTFSNPSTFVNILAASGRMALKTDWQYLLRSPIDDLICKLCDNDLEIALKWVTFEDPILFRNILLTTRHLMRCRSDSSKFQIIYRKIYSLIQNEDVPLSIRFKLFSAFFLSNNSSLLQVFKVLKESPSVSMHQLAAFSFDRLYGKENINTMVDFLNENNHLLNIFCCISLYSIWNKHSIEIIREILTNGNDIQRRIAAEILAFKVTDGHAILEEYSQNEDILCRKAVIGGLRLVKENWATALIEKMNNQDNQWFVRDTAVHALENPHTNELYIPRLLQDPWNAPWLIKYASQKGVGLPEDSSPYELFYSLLETGTIEEQLCVLSYLAEKPDKDTKQRLIKLTKIDSPLREEALSILTLFSHRDSELV